MKNTLARLETQHEALIEALDANDVSAIERASNELADSLSQLKTLDSWIGDPELKFVAERISRLAEAAMRRVNVLNDHARRRASTLATLRGQPVPATYTR